MNIVVCGSLAYDRIMSFPEYFSDHILPDKLHILNVCFVVNGMAEHFGGTAGNIAYALTLMGVQPTLTAAIGHDYNRYFKQLEKHGIATDNVKIIDSEFTAGAYITTDKADNQITGFNPGAMSHSSDFNFDRLDPNNSLVISSPGNAADMINYCRECKRRNIPYIFDPGQQIPVLAAENLLEVITGSKIFIVNDYEFDMVMKKTGQTREELLARSETTIITLGEKGSTLITGGSETAIPPARAAKVVDPTGCGDAYRGGLLAGLATEKTVAESALLGSVCASFAVETPGTQEYTFSPEDFAARLQSIR